MKKDYFEIFRRLYRERYKRKRSPSESINLDNTYTYLLTELRTNGIVVLPDAFTKDFCARMVHCIDDYIHDKTTILSEIANKIAENPKTYKFGVPQEDGTAAWIDKIVSDFRIIHAEKKSAELKSTFSDNSQFKWLGETLLGTQLELNFTMANKTKYVSGNLGSGGGWHRDNNYRHGFKALVYLTDVNEKNGPFQYIKQSYSIKNHLIDFPYPDKYQFSENEMNEYMKTRPEFLLQVIGEAGTVVLFNTNGIHRGKPIEQGVRYAATNYYK